MQPSDLVTLDALNNWAVALMKHLIRADRVTI